MKYIKLIVFFLFSSQFGLAQQINLRGNIIIDNQEELVNLKDILIINKQTEETTLTDEKGNFNIIAWLNDELIVTSNFTDKRQIKINESILQKGTISIHLDLEIIQLAEANVKPLKPKLEDNISKEKSEQEKMFEIIGFNADFKLDMIKMRLATAYVKKYGGVLRYENLLSMKDDFTNDAKNYRPEIRKEKKHNIRMNEIVEIQKFFTDNYFTEFLVIPENKIIDFISYCYSLYDFDKLYRQQNFDQMFYYFEEEAPKYLDKLKTKS